MAPTPAPASYRQAAGIRLRETPEREVVVSGVIVVQADGFVKALAGVAFCGLQVDITAVPVFAIGVPAFAVGIIPIVPQFYAAAVDDHAVGPVVFGGRYATP